MKIDPDIFRIVLGENGDQLIVPNFGVGNKGWSKETLWLRSCHLDKDNKVISVGFNKFFNLNEGPDGLRIDEHDLLDNTNDLVLTDKMDGSLLIRYVRDGEVKFRTRGSLTVGLECWQKDLPELVKMYPELMNPIAYSQMSMLFEYISPDNQIVIKYNKPDLVLIGCVDGYYNKDLDKANFSLGPVKGLLMVAEHMKVRAVNHCIGVKDIPSWITHVKGLKEGEGYVIRIDNGRKLVKVKTETYLKLHALKSSANTKTFVDLWLSWGQPDFAKFNEMLENQFDFEIATYCLPLVSSMFDGIREFKKQREHVENFVAENKALPRKEFSLLATSRFNGNNLSMCFTLLDNREIANRLIKAEVVNKCKFRTISFFGDDNDQE